MTEDQKAMTLRLERDHAEALEIVATVDGQPMSAVIRAALMEHIKTRRADPEFQARLRNVAERNKAALMRLHGECDQPLRLVASQGGGTVLWYECPVCLARVVRSREQAEADAL